MTEQELIKCPNPNCNSALMSFSRKHCDNPGCDWIKCRNLKCTCRYNPKTGAYMYKNKGDAEWTSGTTHRFAA